MSAIGSNPVSFNEQKFHLGDKTINKKEMAKATAKLAELGDKEAWAIMDKFGSVDALYKAIKNAGIAGDENGLKVVREIVNLFSKAPIDLFKPKFLSKNAWKLNTEALKEYYTFRLQSNELPSSTSEEFDNLTKEMETESYRTGWNQLRDGIKEQKNAVKDLRGNYSTARKQLNAIRKVKQQVAEQLKYSEDPKDKQILKNINNKYDAIQQKIEQQFKKICDIENRCDSLTQDINGPFNRLLFNQDVSDLDLQEKDNSFQTQFSQIESDVKSISNSNSDTLQSIQSDIDQLKADLAAQTGVGPTQNK